MTTIKPDEENFILRLSRDLDERILFSEPESREWLLYRALHNRIGAYYSMKRLEELRDPRS